MCSDRSLRSALFLVVVFSGVRAVASPEVPLGLPPFAAPTQGAGLAALGKELFFDKRLSIDGSVSCGTCHLPERLFTDGRSTARGLHHRPLTRRTPSLLNIRYATSLFWDGRAPDLETQVRSPLLAPAEHGLANEREVARIVQSAPGYAAAFESLMAVPREKIGIAEVGSAIAAYERTLVAGDSPFDRYEYGREPSAMGAAAIRGLGLFRGRARCASCHSLGEKDALFTDGRFHASPLQMRQGTLEQLGSLAKQVADFRKQGKYDALSALVASDADVAALGRFIVTLDPKDISSFKTPSLRNIALTGPYMHDGSVATLAEAVNLELYSRSSQRYPLVLSQEEQSDLLQFLAALSSPDEPDPALSSDKR
jgi:cytochrome c peroxidase